MTQQILRNGTIGAACLTVIGCFAGVVWWVGYGAALDGLERRGRSDLALAADSLTSELEQYRALAVLTADHPVVLPALERGVPDAEVQTLLRRVADKSGAYDIILAARDGTILAASYPDALPDLAVAEYFQRALDGAMGADHVFSGIYGRRAFQFAAPVFSDAGPVAGALIVVADIEALEASWRGDRPAVFFTDTDGVIFVSNRSELVFRQRTGGERPFVDHTARDVRGHDLWRVDGGRYLPERALHLTLDLPVIEMTGEILLDVAPARRMALLQVAVAAALCLAFVALLLSATARRRALTQANAALEKRVAQRTAALEQVNADLQHEVTERTAAEEQLKQLQADLVQAGKLSALGHMSAGISHELNQPLMAIQSYAENAQGFLQRDRADVAGENLGRISQLARRMARIIQNLRAFARHESAPIRNVEVISIIDGAVETVAPKAEQTRTRIIWEPPADPLHVIAGEVRLGQVVVNLLSNAMDAMEGLTTRQVTVRVDRTAEQAMIVVTDTGPGITEPEKIFDPFYSTKQVGDGMGLGLSISYGLVQSFGGMIRGQNCAGGGAEFTVTLERADAMQGQVA
ncbi:sensor histidine kinase [Yoonia sp. 208BN28-4]|uniref:sensor histidine kinase n=1 Tax=Yoonia sp. 208BN28-4 TaxID=3126505 RepID=UPI0030AC5635